MEPKPRGFYGGLAFLGLQLFLEAGEGEFSAPSSSHLPTLRPADAPGCSHNPSLGSKAAIGAGSAENELFVIPGNSEVSEGRAGAASLAVAPHPLPH